MGKLVSENQCRERIEKSGEHKLVEYRGKGCDTKHLIEHNVCGYRCLVSYSYFPLHRCKNCAGFAPITEEKCRTVFEDTGEYQLLEYRGKGHQTNHLIKHLVCGYEYLVSYDNFSHNRRCRKCAGRLPVTEEKCRETFEEKGEYRLLEYRGGGIKTKHLIKHLICGRDFPTCYSKFLQGCRCPDCSSSRSENLSRNIFENLFRFKFPKCRPEWLNKLELDGFCEELKIAFEYNGIQHYKVISSFHHDSIEKFQQRQEHDALKKQICRERGIKLCIIPYTVDCYNPDALERFIKCWRRLAFSCVPLF